MGERTSHPHGTISWADLATSDQDGAKAFYSALFGWEYDDQPVGDGITYSLAKVGGRSAAAINPQRPEETEQGVPSHWNLYVTVDDVDAAAKAVGEHGGQLLAEPFDVLDAGRMAVIQDPGGAVLSLWQAGASIGAEVVNVPGAFTWADLATPEPEAALRFFSVLLGWRFETMSEEPPYWVISNDGRSQGGMTRPPTEQGVPPNWFPYFAVADVEATAAAAREAGGQPFMGPMDVPNGGRFVLIQDPQGAPFGVVQGEFDD